MQVSSYSLVRNRIKQKNLCIGSLECYFILSANDFSLHYVGNYLGLLVPGDVVLYYYYYFVCLNNFYLLGELK